MKRIRIASQRDLPAIQRIARGFNRELGFVMRVKLEQSIAKRELFVAKVDGDIVGFVHFHARRDGWQTLYTLAVHPEFQRQGVGRQLLYSVPAPIRLKCTADNGSANHFYAGAGMQLVGVEQGRRRLLNVWEMRILSIFCAGGNKKIPQIARQSGMAYGVRGDYTPYGWPFMVDINWRDYDWTKYYTMLLNHYPVMAMVADYEHPSQRRELYRQIRELKEAGVMRIMVCPKFDGAIDHIPSWCIVAVSVPSQYAGFLPNLSELKARKVHLLGGVPAKQFDLIQKINGAGGIVISLDGSSHESAAKRGSHYESGEWHRKAGQSVDYERTMIYSGKRIVLEANAASCWQQLPLWGAA